ncbi:MAG: nitroreductase/quinone reductase family protein [Anaerolineales bacterium]|jgi:deazaflavin-dependent oxidoreductase (nitroreductase family)
MYNPYLRRIFWLLNKFFMVPLFRLGLGAFMGNPFTGYIMVVKTIGRKTGKVRYTPVNYTIIDGWVYCMVGFGKIADWYRNIQERPQIELLLPSGPMAGEASQVSDPQESLKATRQLLKNAGFAGFFLGFNPFSAPDDLIEEKTKEIPMICVRPTGIGSGAGDSGGWLWVLVFLFFAWLILR